MSCRAGIQTKATQLQEPVLLGPEQHIPQRMDFDKMGGNVFQV